MKTTPFQIAILQGRLSPDTENRYQFFPRKSWQQEFQIAHDIGFNGIEWLIDPKDWEKNPVFSDFTEAETLAREKSLPIVSICADWFMDVCIWEGDPETHRANIRSLIPRLIKTTNKLLLIPLLETHSIFEWDIQKKVSGVLRPLKEELEKASIHIGFETELSATQLVSFLDLFESEVFGVYYDIGNCTSYGFNCPEDILLLAKKVKGVHVKDRKIGTTKPVPLGQGDADYLGVFKALSQIGWQGTLVMQAWRGPDYLEDAKTQLDFVRNCLTRI